MSKAVKRVVSGVLAVLIFASAVSLDSVLTGFDGAINTSAEEYPHRWGSYDAGLFDEQQDTYFNGTNKLYNTAYGIHTDKTVSKYYNNGRKFDLDLESWYIGERPADVGLILDASGSMAWTTKSLKPLNVLSDEKVIQSGLNELYGKEDFDGDGSFSIDDLIALQNENGGYLPQEVVDLILDPTKTDNSKLNYNGYKYYLYEERPSVSEFVPLGYWDGGSNAIDDENLIGYYPFNGSLKNEAPEAPADSDGKLIAMATAGSNVDTEPLKGTVKPTFNSSKGLDISKTAPIGGVMLDKVPTTNTFSIKMEIRGGEKATENSYLTPILCITDGTHYYKITRPGNTSSNRLRIGDENSNNNILDVNSAFKGTEESKKTWTFTFTFDDDGSLKNLNVVVDGKVKFDTDTTEKTTYSKDFNTGDIASLDLSKLQIIVGGSKTELTPYSQVFVKNLEIADDTGKTIAKYPLTNNLSETNGGEATFVQQAYKNGGTFSETALPEAPEVSPTYKDNALDLNATAKKGTVMLGAVPDLDSTDGFTLSMKLMKTGGLTKSGDKQNIFYLGSKDTTSYYQFFRSSANGGALVLSDDQTDETTNDKFYYKGGLVDSNKWYTNTLVFEKLSDGNFKVTPYVDGKPAQTIDGKTGFPNGTNTDGSIKLGDYNVPESIESFTVSKDKLVLLLGALESNAAGSNHYIDDFYVFNSALTPAKVNLYFNELCDATEYNSDGTVKTAVYHAKTADGEDIAQIDKSLAQNPNDDERRGWYYVNSHSTWKDITGCLKSGKQYIGIAEDSGASDEDKKDIATVPSYYSELTSGNELVTENLEGNTGDAKKYTAPATERSIRFYVDKFSRLRCFAYAGGTSTEGDPRTFCSVVYVNPDVGDPNRSEIKYETLNDALNMFFTLIQTASQLTNLSAVRFSTYNLLTKGDTSTAANLADLVMQKWTNRKDSGILQDLVKMADDANSATVTANGEHEYAMTGGTYTWTGLRAFYERIHQKDADVAKDGRLKYLIIFTDGRDNTWTDKAKAEEEAKSKGVDPSYKKDYINFAPDGKSVSYDYELAEAWADKLKEEGYTIFTVMMATGSVSESANPDVYNSAKEFLTNLAGASQDFLVAKGLTKDDIPDERFVFISDPADDEVPDPNDPNNMISPLEYQFRQIVDMIKSSLSGYTIQDYIDPRFDLVTYANDKEEGEVIYLNAGGKIEVVGKATTTTATVGNAFGETASGAAKAATYEYVTKDGKKANLYFDEEKDMYYLRWNNQPIGGGTSPFTTDEKAAEPQYLSGEWSSTITIVAKPDFIGGNAVITNGNEAGMNLVFSSDSIEGKTADEEREILKTLSGTNNSKDRDSDNEIIETVIPSKGFPRPTVNVRLQDIKTKDLNDVIYLGEVVSPTQMLVDLEDDYMTGSYYLEYLERYAYRIYGDSYAGAATGESSGRPLIDLLNRWLKIVETDATKKSFTIPYMYLPDPLYDDKGYLVDESGLLVTSGADAVFTNNTGTEEYNQKDITGILTYTWERVKAPAGAPVDITENFLATKSEQVEYRLSMRFTPLKADDIALQDSTDYVFLTQQGTSTFERSDKFFTVEDGNFTKAETSSDPNAKWDFCNRSEYNQALVSDTVYEWDKDYKPTQGYEQVESGHRYGDGTIDENGSLNAHTIYTKDVVNAAVAVQMMIKGSDLSASTTIGDFKAISLTAYRFYQDELDDDGSLKANTASVGDEYQLQFTIGDVPSGIVSDQTYTVWATLSSVSKISGDGHDFTNVTDAQLPIGTYKFVKNKITSGLTITSDKNFKYVTANESASDYVYSRFPTAVTSQSQSHVDSGFGKDYTIYPTGGPDNSSQNIADTDGDSDNLYFLFGTQDNTGTKGISKKDDPETTKEYVKDRLGIIRLSYGSGSLAVSKEVTNSKLDKNLNNLWKFTVKVKASDPKEIKSLTFTVQWTDLEGNIVATPASALESVTFSDDADSEDFYTTIIYVPHGYKATILNLPNDAKYIVSEPRTEQGDGFDQEYMYKTYVGNISTESDTGTGTIVAGSEVHFINQFPEVELPSTGGVGTKIYLIAGSILTLLGVTAMLVIRKKGRQVKRE